MKLQSIILPWWFLLQFGPDNAIGGKILFLCPACSKSHKNFMEPTIFALADRNHVLTIVSCHKTEAHRNIRDIQIQEDFDLTGSNNVIAIRLAGTLEILRNQTFTPKVVEACRATYENQEFMKLLEETWDLVIIDGWANECLYGFIYKLGAPWIISMPLPPPLFLTPIMGLRQPSSFIPETLLYYSNKMNLWERIFNFVFTNCVNLVFLGTMPAYEEIYREYLQGEDIPGILEFRMTASLMLTNSHFAVNYPRPWMPDIVEVGGIQCRPGKPLPEDLAEFIAGAKDGVIIFSLGSIVRGQNMPDEVRKIFVKAFAGIKQRVIWKWDYLPMNDLSPNVKLYKWLPLQDILAQPNVKLFITHGGLLSTQEAICHGVPMVGIPVLGDQDLNMKRYVDAGIALVLEITTLTTEELLVAINTVLQLKFKESILRLSTLYLDRPMGPLELAVYWVEYIIRHKGAPHLRSSSRSLSTIQYHSIDVIVILISTIVTIIALGTYICLFVCYYGVQSTTILVASDALKPE